MKKRGLRTKYMFIFFILILVMFFSISMTILTPKKNLEKKFEEYYGDTGKISGFKDLSIVNLYDSKWVLDICNLYGIRPPQLNGLQEEIKSFDLFDDNQKQNNVLSDFPQMPRIEMLLELAKASKTSLPDKMQKEIIDYIQSLKQEDSSYSLNNSDVSFMAVKILILLENFKDIDNATLSKIEANKKIPPIAYYYLKNKYGIKLIKEEINAISNYEINIDTQTDYVKLSDAYLIKSIQKNHKIDETTKISVDKNIVKAALGKFIEPDINNVVDLQVLYKLLFISDYKPTPGEMKGLKKIIGTLFLKKSWGQIQTLFDLNTTYYGLVVFNKEQIKYNVKNIKNLLDQRLNNILSYSSNLNAANLYELRLLSYCYNEIKDKNALATIKEYIIEKTIASKANELNQIPPNVILDLYNFYQDEVILKALPDELTLQQIKFNEMVPELEALRLHYQLLNVKNSLTNDDKEKLIQILSKFHKEDGGFSFTVEDKSTLAATMTALEMIQEFRLEFPKTELEKYIETKLFYNKDLGNLKEYGILIKAHKFLEKDMSIIL
ncbi:hypothetical protein YDYSY3_23300 [Paenibacillus chitinolyticus]|uniref:prenyltransferase/squalene oxidase repeat-containing protein n=1 Tax=Paenibacillus chitinolyticus TaxID=79263 RepID=UPI0026E4EA95|nr:hypothetical protein [Paenibacillus chitinolyticus]GKS11330.1 hypothetical protein YDYSY3_23300 [Paenibacillus chitinolyticus]